MERKKITRNIREELAHETFVRSEGRLSAGERCAINVCTAWLGETVRACAAPVNVVAHVYLMEKHQSLTKERVVIVTHTSHVIIRHCRQSARRHHRHRRSRRHSYQCSRRNKSRCYRGRRNGRLGEGIDGRQVFLGERVSAVCSIGNEVISFCTRIGKVWVKLGGDNGEMARA